MTDTELQDPIDDLETLITLSMSAIHSDLKPIARVGKFALFDSGTLLPFDDMLPWSSYTIDATDRERIFAAKPELLLAHPAEILGERAETMAFFDGLLKWRAFRRLRKAPKGVSCLGRASFWYEYHVRHVYLSGLGEYAKRVVPFDRHGNPLPAMVQNQCVCSPIIEGVMAVACAAVIEDAHRPNSMLACVSEQNEIKFPVPLGDYRRLFAQRDKPDNGSRRKAILHWVSKHLRRSLKIPATVKRHTRGVQEFTVDGIRIRLTPNKLYEYPTSDTRSST